MTSAYRVNRKASDEDLIKLNNLGLSLQTIAEIIGCHPTTVTQRLKALGIPVADTRRSFMEDVYKTLTQAQRDHVAEKLGNTTTIKEYVRKLILNDYLGSQ
ncbi:hypothetical protein HYP99_gp053 [Sinorhizobium phage ort11]|uniref:Uncharacterized protein n=1 Tax=Sinorhizobium phage ort11 TaxID=2599764 RepID=A0A5C2H747_9CAUD|nr:hypothetical protein HYP99_gp053 [Sinorhizobium phage ort11]QEP29851.1 hypothetical protein Smphiort11_053 [Sinorhizobium phage ort11]